MQNTIKEENKTDNPPSFVLFFTLYPIVFEEIVNSIIFGKHEEHVPNGSDGSGEARTGVEYPDLHSLLSNLSPV